MLRTIHDFSCRKKTARKSIRNTYAFFKRISTDKRKRFYTIGKITENFCEKNVNYEYSALIFGKKVSIMNVCS